MADDSSHLYSMPARGNDAPMLLTPGEHKVEHITMAADRRFVLYDFSSDGRGADRGKLVALCAVRGGDRAARPHRGGDVAGECGGLLTIAGVVHPCG